MMGHYARVFSVILAACFLVSSAWAEDRFDAALASGEFAVALAEAQQIEAGPARDQALARIAQAQVDADALRPAQFVLAQIRDDAFRQGAIDNRGAAAPNGQFRGNGGQAGGGAQADFDTLIDLITTTVEPDTWEELGGEGAIAAFPGGVYVDPSGLLKSRRVSSADGDQDVCIPKGWHCVSLPRLEKRLQLSRVVGQPPSLDLRTLGGLASIEMLVVYPKTGDIVIAGPSTNAADALRLEDLAVVMHHAFHQDAPFGCSIDPRPNNLAATQVFLNESARTPLQPGQRPKWVNEVASKMGRQDVSVFGLDPDTTTAAALVEADYHMKLVGLGLAGPAVIPSYLDRIDGDEQLNLVRWWFTLGFDAIEVESGGDVYRFAGNPVRLVSEQELMDAAGRRTATGKTSNLNREFAQSFTANYDDLADQYPVYRRLRNIFQLATMATLLKREGLADRVGWQPTALASLDSAIRTNPATTVDTMVNHKVIDRTKIVLVASGGVEVDPTRLIGEMREVDDAALAEKAAQSAPQDSRGVHEDWSW